MDQTYSEPLDIERLVIEAALGPSGSQSLMRRRATPLRSRTGAHE
jgi:hypothetical protein